MAVLSSGVNFQRISKTADLAKKGVATAGKSIQNISQMVLKRTKIKSEIFNQTKTLRNRRVEAERRKQLEDEIEAVDTLQKPGGAQNLAQADNSKGFFERLIGFVGYLTAGWILNNLPTLLGIGKEFIARLQRAGQLLSGFFNNTIQIFANFGNVLGALGQNIASFDFLDSSNRLRGSLDQLNSTVAGLGAQIEEAFGLVTTPLTQGKYSGEDIPAPGTEQQSEGAYETQPPYSGEETTSGGKVVSPQAIYSYLKQLGVSDIHAIGILANIKGESGFRIDADETGKGTAGIGLFQYTYPSRKQAFLRAVPDYKTNWKGQINYAITQDPNTPLYLRKQFNSAEEAADDFMRNWENPSKSVYAGRRKKHNDFIKSFKSGSTRQSISGQPTSRPSIVTSGSAQYTSGTSDTGGGFSPDGAKDVYGRPVVLSRSAAEAFSAMMRDSKGVVKGSDIASSQRSLEKNARIGGAVRSKHLKGLALDIHGSSNSWMRKYGARYGWYANDYSGSHGGHFEFKGGTSLGTSEAPPAQISAPPQQQRRSYPSGITPDRRGQDIIIAQPPSQQNIITSGGGGGGDSGMTPTTNFALLNNFIKNKLLLDLAYL